LLDQPMRYKISIDLSDNQKARTVLLELEPVFNACLITGEQEASSVLGLSRLRFLTGDFRAKLDTSTHDAPEFDRNWWDWGRWCLEVVSGVSLPNMGGERAA